MMAQTFDHHCAVLGLDPRTIRYACRADSDPRIKSEGNAVGEAGMMTFRRAK